MVRKSKESAPNYWFVIACIAVALLVAVIFMSKQPTDASGPLASGNIYGEAIGGGAKVAATLGPAKTSCNDVYATKLNSCSKAKPKFCTSSGQLVSNSIKCGCPAGQIPQTGGTCFAPQPYQMSTYIHDDLDYQPDSVRYTTETSRFGSGVSYFLPNMGPKYLKASLAQPLSLPNNGLIYSGNGLSVTEENHALLFAYTSYDETVKAVQAKYAKTGYVAMFNQPLPLCFDLTKSASNCPAAQQLKNSNLKIWVLGSSWYVRDYWLEGGSIINLKLVREDGKTMFLKNGYEVEIVNQPGAAKNWYNNIVSDRYILPAAYDPWSLGVKKSMAIALSDGSTLTDDFVVVDSAQNNAFNFGSRIVDEILFRVRAPSEIYYLDANGLYQKSSTGGNVKYDPGADVVSFSLLKAYSMTFKDGTTITGDIMLAVAQKPEVFRFGERKVNDIYYMVSPLSNNSNSTMGDIYYLDIDGYFVKDGRNSLTYYLSNPDGSESISAIRIYNDLDQTYKIPISQTLNAGEKIGIIKYPMGFSFKYVGDGPTMVADTLQFTVQRSITLTTIDGSINGDFIYIVSGLSNAFQFPGRSVPDVYVVVNGSGYSCSNMTGGNGSGNGTSCGYGPLTPGGIFYLDSSGYIKYGGFNYAFYHYRTDERADIYFDFSIPNGVAIKIPEKISDTEAGNVFTHYSNWHLNILYDKNLRQFVNVIGSSTVDKIGYSYLGNENFATKEIGYTSYRGTEFHSISPTSAVFYYPPVIVKKYYQLVANGDDIAWTSTSTAPAQK
ncbi:MAG TPA: hypothetical protein VJI13_00605 [Candidatus Norongarragalinales archaeon]|nr:hypothetical protein [Candidatus Norongarragalinales archaeon]